MSPESEQPVHTKQLPAQQPGTGKGAVPEGVILEPGTGERLVKALEERIEQADSWLRRARDLARHAPLGDNVVGKRMAEKFHGRADGGDSSLVGALEGYRAELVDARDGVRDAMRRYDEDEQARAGNLSRIAH